MGPVYHLPNPMRYPQPLIEGTWLRRYQRFLLDVRLKDTHEITVVHCPNTGSMLGVNRPGSRCLLLPSHNPKRRLAYTLEAVRVGKRWVGTHPARANTIGLEAIMAGLVSAVPQIASARAEVAYGTSSRADWVLQTRHGDVWTVEIK
ncbi:MAG TPA: hypothetical protein PKW66_16320, partial [Polyangiaceae bacterium]|nr:hypothetical protein [Polyangiaceae bacterium]